MERKSASVVVHKEAGGEIRIEIVMPGLDNLAGAVYALAEAIGRGDNHAGISLFPHAESEKAVKKGIQLEAGDDEVPDDLIDSMGTIDFGKNV